MQNLWLISAFSVTFYAHGGNQPPCKMLITDMEELRAFEEMTGIDLEGNECFECFGDADYDAFNSMCIAVEIVAYDMSVYEGFED